MKTLTNLCLRRKVRFWGHSYYVMPRLVNWIHGDGLQVIWWEPMDTRPDYYVARIDSAVDMNNCGKPPVFCDEVLDDLRDEIQNQYSQAYEEWEAGNGRTYTRHNPFPALGDSCGSSWGRLCVLKKPDRRSDRRIRKDIKRSKTNRTK